MADNLQNGGPQQLPAITIGWDSYHQLVRVHFDTDQFRTWDFALAVLDMAKKEIERQQKTAMINQMQQQASEAQQAQALAQKLQLGR